MEGTTSAASGSMCPEAKTTQARDYSTVIDMAFIEGEMRPMRKTAIRRAEVKIARRFSTGRTGLVSSIVDTLLYETTLAFKDHSKRVELSGGETVLLLLDAELLAEEEGCTTRSIQQVFQDLEECGYIHRGRGGAYDSQASC